LIELMLVILILGILLAVALPTFLNQQGKAQATAVETQLTNAAHSATYTFTSYGKGVFPTDTIAQLAHSEPELNITCGDTYIKGQVSAYFKNATSCTPSGATVLDLRGVSDDGTYYVEQLNYTDTKRSILRLKGDAESTTNYVADPGFEGFSNATNPQAYGCSYQDAYPTGNQVLGHSIVSSQALDGDHSLQLTILDADSMVSSGNTNAFSTVHCDNTNIADPGDLTGGAYIKAPTGVKLIAYMARMVNGVPPWNANFPPGGVAGTKQCTGVFVATGDWQPVSCTLQAYDTTLGTPNGVDLRVGFYANAAANLSNGDVAYVDDMMVNSGATMQPYFDGSFPDAQWNGAANDSISNGYAWSSW